MRFLIILVFLANISLLLEAQVTGKVIDAVSHKAVSGAHVSDNRGSVYITGPDGVFTIGPGSGILRYISVRHIGYVGKRVDINGKKSGLVISLLPDYTKIEEVAVTATSFLTRLKKSAGSVSILPSEVIDEDRGITLAGALNQLPGVYMAQGALNTNRLIIRGIGSRTPYSTNRIRAYFGDIPLTNGDGMTTLEDIDAASVGRIEVIRGPSSAIYGSGLGGVVRMVPFYPEKRGLRTEISSEAGSFGTFRNYVKTGFNRDDLSAASIYSDTRSKGFRQNSDYSRKAFFLAGNLPRTRNNFKFLLNYTGIRASIPSSVDEQTFLHNPQHAAANWLRIEGFEKSRRLLAGVTYNHDFNSQLTIIGSVFSSMSDHYESRPFNILSDHSFSAGIREQLQFKKGSLKINPGAELYTENYFWNIYETLSGKQGDLLNNNKENRSWLNIFTHLSYNGIRDLTFEAGLNANVLRYTLRDEPTGGSGHPLSYTYEPVFSPRAGVNYSLTGSWYVYASAGHGFSAPSLEETLLPQGRINPALKPEQGWNYDFGTRGSVSGMLHYDVSLYYIRLRNLLVTKRLSEDTFMGINAGKTAHYGLETYLRLDAIKPERKDGRSLVLRSSLTLSRNRFLAFDDEGVDYSGNILPGIPVVIGDLNGKFTTSFDLQVVANFNYTGSQYMNDANTKIYGSYKTLDLRISWGFPVSLRESKLVLFGGLVNVFDEQYASMILVNAPSFNGSDPRYYYPGQPLNAYLGIRLSGLFL